MPKREDDIRDEIKRLDDAIFERFVVALLSREYYPGLNPTSRSHDLGEDARTEPTTLFKNNGKWISLAASKEYGWGKLRGDCERCVQTSRHIDVLVFVTAGNPQADTIERWKIDVKATYQWDLEVHTINFLAPYASRPQFEDLISDYLSVPPPGGDFIFDIEEKFNQITSHYLQRVHPTVQGMYEPIPRDEVRIIEEQFSQGRLIVMTGDAGTGKSGIAALVIQNGIKNGKVPLFLDAQRLGNLKSNGELRAFFDLSGSPYLAIKRIGQHKGCRIIIDQLDNIVGFPSSDIILELVSDLSLHPVGFDLMMVCRNKEPHEKELLEKLLSIGFIEIICHEINEDVVENTLSIIGIDSYSPELVSLGRNLLNLDIIGQIHLQDPKYDFSTLTDEVYLWESYVHIWCSREGQEVGEKMLQEATKLARLGLNHPDGMFETDFPCSIPLQRLISWGIISHIDGRIFRFRHEKFQDFLYARESADLQKKPKVVLGEILEYKTLNVFRWMRAIYSHRKSSALTKFVQEVFDV